MTFQEAEDMANLYNISPELTCTCDEYHICQQCDISQEFEEKCANEYGKYIKKTYL